MKKNKWWPLTNKEYYALIKRVNNGDAYDEDDDPVVVPKDETDAVKLTIAKWHPSRGTDAGESEDCFQMESCGCCTYYDGCDTCILRHRKTGGHCVTEGIAFKYACKRLEELNA